MALTVEDGTGLALADSYASLAETGAYLAAYGHTAWAAGTEADQESALRRATAWIDSRYRTRFRGLPLRGRLQSLAWPRTAVLDRDGYAIAAGEIPSEIVRATAEAALRELASPGALTPAPAERIVKRERNKVGEIEEEIEYADAGIKARPQIAVIEDILAPLLIGVGGSMFGTAVRI